VLRKMSGIKRKELTGGLRKFSSDKLCKCWISRIGWSGCVACMGEKRSA